jgi:hypothetical protein
MHHSLDVSIRRGAVLFRQFPAISTVAFDRRLRLGAAPNSISLRQAASGDPRLFSPTESLNACRKNFPGILYRLSHP